MRHRFKPVVPVVALVVAFLVAVTLILLVTSNAQAASNSRKVTISYNSALSLHQAAMPPRYDVGDRFNITYRGRTLVVKAIPGSCKCLDISDEGMDYLASTGKGLIEATVEER